jgi:hypothetical protein
MSDLFTRYVSNILVNTRYANDDVVKVETNYLSPEGDVYVLDKRVISPSVLTTTSSLEQLQPEVSTIYPYKVTVPTDPNDGASIIFSPDVGIPVTASQNYYAPVYTERYNPTVIAQLDKRFLELTVPDELSESVPPGEG